MTLPRIDSILYDVEIPSTKKTVKIRQIRAKDEKILLTAKESSGTPEERNVDILNAIKQVINNAIVTPGINVETLALFDIEFLFIRLRALSVSNIIQATYQDFEEMNDYQTALADFQAQTEMYRKANKPPVEPEPYKFDIDLNKVSVKWPENYSKDIRVPENNILIKMKYPDASLYTNKEFLAASGEKLVDYLIQNSISEIVSGTETTVADKIPLPELVAFLDDLPVLVYDKIREFLSNLPHVYYEINYVNKKAMERKIVLDKLSDFFSF